MHQKPFFFKLYEKHYYASKTFLKNYTTNTIMDRIIYITPLGKSKILSSSDSWTRIDISL